MMKRMVVVVVVIGVLFAATPAWATDFSQPILGEDFITPIKVCADDTPTCKTSLTLGWVSMRALCADLPATPGADIRQAPLPGEEKFKRCALGMKVQVGGDIDLNLEDTLLIKKVIGQAFAPSIVVQTWKMLDPKAGETK